MVGNGGKNGRIRLPKTNICTHQKNTKLYHLCSTDTRASSVCPGPDSCGLYYAIRRDSLGERATSSLHLPHLVDHLAVSALARRALRRRRPRASPLALFSLPPPHYTRGPHPAPRPPRGPGHGDGANRNSPSCQNKKPSAQKLRPGKDEI